LDAAADTTPALITIDESLDTGQRDSRSMATSAQVVAARHSEPARAEGFRHARCTFSRRLQLAPGLVPPTSWSPSPCVGPKIYWRAESLKSPGPEGICLEVSPICAMNLRSAHASRAEPLTPRCALFPHKGTPVLINYAGSRSESVRGSRSPGSRSADRGGVSNLVRWRHARLVGEGAGAVVGPGARSRSSSEVGQSC
jgi:hypothetical protein